MVLIHGIGSSRTIWDRVRVPLEERFDVIAVDLPGFGDQPWFGSPVPERMESLATAVEEELDRLGIERAHLVGHSMGGWIALELARRGRAIDVLAIAPIGGATEREARASKRELARTRFLARAGAHGERLRRAGVSGTTHVPLNTPSRHDAPRAGLSGAGVCRSTSRRSSR